MIRNAYSVLQSSSFCSQGRDSRLKPRSERLKGKLTRALYLIAVRCLPLPGVSQTLFVSVACCWLVLTAARRPSPTKRRSRLPAFNLQEAQ